MSKYTKDKKVLTQNPGLTARPFQDIRCLQKSKKVHFAEENSKNGCMNGLTSPEFCTLLQITDEIKRIRNTNGSTSTAPSGPRYRNLNFLPGEKIFQNLIGLNLPEETLQPKTRSQPSVNLNLIKDPEPTLNEFLKCSFQSEYLFTSYSSPLKKKQKTKCDGHSIYYKMKLWEEEFYHM